MKKEKYRSDEYKLYKAALSNEVKRGRNKFSGYKSKGKQINWRNKVKKKISLVLLTVLIICSCGRKQDLTSPVHSKYVDSHAVTNNNLNTNMLNLTEEQMNAIFPYIKYVAYSSALIGVAAIVYMIPPTYNFLCSAGTLIMKGLSLIPKIREIGFVKNQSAKPIFGKSSPSIPEFPKEMTVNIANNSAQNPIHVLQAPPPQPAEE
ncbi:MAG: hypothetical protein LE169_02990 [Endomicrobium sp.]|nr:hypothetical protein [Endomicrobium sp.]